MMKRKIFFSMITALTIISSVSGLNSKAVDLTANDLIADGKLDVFDMIEMRKEVVKGNKTVAQAVELERFLLGMEQVIDVNVSPDTYESLETYKKILDNYNFVGTDNPDILTINYIFESNTETLILKSKDICPEDVNDFLYEKSYETESGAKRVIRIYNNKETNTLFLTYNPKG